MTQKSELNPSPGDSIDDLPYEQAFAALEEVVAALEAGDTSLENSLALYERGQLLARRCAALLDRAELKIQQLSGDSLTDIALP